MKFTRLSTKTRVRIVQCFIEDIGAAQAARLLALNRKTVNQWYEELRLRVSKISVRLPGEADSRALRGFHSRRVSKFNGLPGYKKALHEEESLVRFVLKTKFKNAVRDAASDLLM